MVNFDQLLEALYEIQGASDPNNQADSAQERFAEIFSTASRLLEQSGWQPEEVK